MNNEPYIETGALSDYRTDEQKAKDWRPQEAFPTGGPIEWREKTIEEVEAEIFATSVTQNHTLRCVSEYAGIFLETAEYLETGRRIVFSRRDIYCRRANRPQGGMSMPDLFKLMREGACYESQLRSDAVYESEINQPYQVTTAMIEARATHASGASFTWDKWTIDDLANMLQERIPVCLFWFFESSIAYKEWWRAEPVVVSEQRGEYDEESSRHQATGVSFLLHQGKKCIAVMDSAGQGTGLGTKKNIRIVSEDFIRSRNYGAGIAIDKKNLDHVEPVAPQCKLSRTLQVGSIGDDVKALQRVLVYEGCMNLKAPTGEFWGMTRSGVIALQKKYASEILAPIGLKNPTGIVGAQTIKFINNKYNK